MLNKYQIRALYRACRLGYKVIAVLALVLCVELVIAVSTPAVEHRSVTYRQLIVRTAEPETLFPLSEEEEQLICEVVMAEAGGEIYAGQLAVAQCIRNACELDGLSPAEAIEEYGYTRNREEPSASVRIAVAAVFRDGDMAIDDDILFFYAPDRTTSKWHETQRYAGTIGGHRFFCASEVS